MAQSKKSLKLLRVSALLKHLSLFKVMLIFSYIQSNKQRVV